MISESYSEFMASRHYVYNFAASMDLSSFGASLDSDAVKLIAAPMAKDIADRAMQVSLFCHAVLTHLHIGTHVRFSAAMATRAST
jgi:alkylation response protein AidB-like acyl-CoA dehydrogenase